MLALEKLQFLLLLLEMSRVNRLLWGVLSVELEVNILFWILCIVVFSQVLLLFVELSRPLGWRILGDDCQLLVFLIVLC